MAVKQLYFSSEERDLLEYIEQVRGGKSFSSYMKELIEKDREAQTTAQVLDKLAEVEKEVTRMANLLSEAVKPQFIAYPQFQQVPAPAETEKPKPKMDDKQKRAMSSIMALTSKK